MKTVLVTGGSRGIGAEISTAFAKAGYRVIINYFNSRESAESICGEIKASGGDAYIFGADVSDKASVAQLRGFVERNFGKLDALICNAGISLAKQINDCTESDISSCIGVNLVGAINCVAELVPLMISQKYGKIINISSIWGLYGASCESVYSAAKAGLIGFTKSLAKELAPSGITVNAIAPGAVKTDMLSGYSQAELEAFRAEIPALRLGTTADVASAALFLASAGADYITGEVIKVSGGY